MFASAPPRSTSVAGAPAPSLLTINHLTLGPADGRHVTEYPPRPAAMRYLADMVTPYGGPYSEQHFLDGNHNSYAYLGERLLAEAGLCPELLLVAHSTADCEPGRSLSGHLSTMCPGDPLVFAVSDQGDLGPFSALRILRQYVAAGWRRDALLLILDQSTLPYPGARPAGHERTDHAIGLAFGPGADGGAALTSVAQRFDVSPAAVTGALAEIADGLPETAAPVTVIATDAVLRHAELPPALAGQLRVAQGGPRCVPPWATLATLVADGVTGRIVLVEYDESLAGLAVAVFDGPVEPEALR
jgi:hypothetical protein